MADEYGYWKGGYTGGADDDDEWGKWDEAANWVDAAGSALGFYPGEAGHLQCVAVFGSTHALIVPSTYGDSGDYAAGAGGHTIGKHFNPYYNSSPGALKSIVPFHK